MNPIDSQGKLTDALRASILSADNKARLEDIYLPYKPKRRTKAQIAIEAGLLPLADALLADPRNDPKKAAEPYVNAEKNIATIDAALDGARAILTERFAEDADLIGGLRELYWSQGALKSEVREGKEAAGAKFSDYFDFSEPLTKLPSHRILAMFRGEKEEALDLELVAEKEPGIAGYESRIARRFAIEDKGRPGDRWLLDTVRWAWRTKIELHLSVDARARLFRQAEEEAIRVFAGNLRDLLLAAPAGARATLGLDPGFRTGVKVAVVDATGKITGTSTIYPHEPQRRWNEALDTLAKLARVHKVELIAIGNGTASRETDKLAADLIARNPELKLTKIVVSEAGASVYSASEYASKELPQLDVSLRGAVSIARRLQDPLAELVKIDPKSIGVGQYQHDVSEIEALSLARRGRGGLRQCGRRRRQHGLGAAARAGFGRGRSARAKHRRASRRERAVQDARRVEGRAAARTQGFRAERGLPAHRRRRRSARPFRRASGVLPAGAQNPRGDGQGHSHADRRCDDATRAKAAGLRR